MRGEVGGWGKTGEIWVLPLPGRDSGPRAERGSLGAASPGGGLELERPRGGGHRHPGAIWHRFPDPTPLPASPVAVTSPTLLTPTHAVGRHPARMSTHLPALPPTPGTVDFSRRAALRFCGDGRKGLCDIESLLGN